MDATQIGQRLKEARTRLRIATIEEAAARIGMSASTLYKYEAGSPPGSIALIKIAKAYQVSADWLLGLRADMTGLPIGQFVVRDAVVQAILEARCAEDLAELIRDPDVFEWWHQVEAESRVTSLEEWLALRERVKKHLHPFLEKIRELGSLAITLNAEGHGCATWVSPSWDGGTFEHPTSADHPFVIT